MLKMLGTCHTTNYVAPQGVAHKTLAKVAYTSTSTHSDDQTPLHSRRRKRALRLVFECMQSIKPHQRLRNNSFRAKCPSKASSVRAVASSNLEGMACSLTTGMRPPIILFGDSITQQAFAGGWGSDLAEKYIRKADVMNRGLSGYNTDWALLAMPKSLVKGALLLTIFFGANDCALPEGTSHRQHVPIPQYKTNLEAMVTLAKGAGVQNILLITPPPVDEAARVAFNKGMHGADAKATAERSNAGAGEYAAACKEVASAAKVPVVDLWTALQAYKDWKALLSDGLHLSPLGNKAVFAEINRVLVEEMPTIAPDMLPLDLPLHGDLTHETAAAVLASYQPIE